MRMKGIDSGEIESPEKRKYHHFKLKFEVYNSNNGYIHLNDRESDKSICTCNKLIIISCGIMGMNIQNAANRTLFGGGHSSKMPPVTHDVSIGSDLAFSRVNNGRPIDFACAARKRKIVARKILSSCSCTSCRK